MPNVEGLVKQLTDPANPTAVADFDAFVAAFADQIDGLWASTMREIRASDSGPRIRATLIQEGRASTGSRRELFTPGAVQWAAEGVELRTEHRGKAETRAVPSREADGRIVIDAPATPALFAAVHDGKRFASVEFFALEERTTPTGVREVARALVTGATVTDRPEYDSTSAEIRERQQDLERRARVWL